MHRQRIKLFAAVEGDSLNYQHFEGLVKSVALEQANAARQIWAIKDDKGWPKAKVNAANVEASQREGTFIDLFRTEKGELPEKVEEVWESHVVTACITCARLALQRTVCPLVAVHSLDWQGWHALCGSSVGRAMVIQMHVCAAGSN